MRTLALGQARRGHGVRVAALCGEEELGADFAEHLRGAGIPLDNLSITTGSILAERRFVRELCRRYRPSVVHTHGYRPDVVDGGVARRLGIPVVSTEHGTGWSGLRGRVIERLQLRALCSFDAVVAVSGPIAELLAGAGVDPERIRTIPNAWADDVDFLPRDEARNVLELPADAFIVGWVGRLIDAKGCDVFLRALAEVRDTGVVGAVVGAGRRSAPLRELARTLGLEERVHFLGEVSEAARLFKAFDVFTLSSRTEGSPVVLLEAMAADVPLVATRVGGVPSMVSDEHAWLVPSDDPDALAGRIREAARDPASGRKRVERARARLADYAVEPWLDRYDAVYRDVVERARSVR